MTQGELQRDVRSAISITYELLRHEHVLSREHIARALGDLESELARIEAKLGGPRRGDIVAASLDPSMDRVEQVAADADPVVADQIRTLVASLREIQRELAVASRQLLETSPVPLYVVAGGAVGLGALASVAFARAKRSRTRRSRAAGAAVAMTLAGVAVALAAMRRRA